MFAKSLKVKGLLSLLVIMVAFNAHAVVKYPLVKEWYGQVWVTGKDGKRLQVRNKQILREKALLETSLSGQVKVQLDENRMVTLMGDSVLSIPIISWEEGDAPVLILKSGEMQWTQRGKEKPRYNIALRSDLFEFIAPPGDFIFSIYPTKAFAGVKVLEGTIEFSALNGEESVTVKTGQQAGFQGVLEGGEISYDVLLKGKKIPKGQLTSVTSLDAKELSRAADEEKKRRQDIAKKQARAREAIAKAKREGVICSAPPAKFNECAWICLNNPKSEKKACAVDAGASCVRRRCNANGEWAEETVLSAEKSSTSCRPQPRVAPCDY
ncbi:hypothetical protein [Bdellovibrio bacteriovorus]|uniref:hypothetical protein n=1 Tax=Bdellovibrio bacteriovorus TaxID=959 RepID=UPI0035A5D086